MRSCDHLESCFLIVEDIKPSSLPARLLTRHTDPRSHAEMHVCGHTCTRRTHAYTHPPQKGHSLSHTHSLCHSQSLCLRPSLPTTLSHTCTQLLGYPLKERWLLDKPTRAKRTHTDAQHVQATKTHPTQANTRTHTHKHAGRGKELIRAVAKKKRSVRKKHPEQREVTRRLTTANGATWRPRRGPRRPACFGGTA